MTERKVSLSADYALAQLARAVDRARESSDPALQGRASARVERWRQVLEGMASGSIAVGSRTPVADVPAWATLEVLHGGFASGTLLASGPLEPHERELAAQLGLPDATDRAALNLHALGDEGREELRTRFVDGRYRVQLPEEGALLVVAWLLDRGEAGAASALLDELAPLFPRLRFYPVPDPRPFLPSAVVHVQPISDTVEALRDHRPQAGVARMREAITVWTPLYDRTVALFLETVDGDIPHLRTDADGQLVRGAKQQPVVEGGAPCRRFAPDWHERAAALLREYESLRGRHRLCSKPESKKENFARLRSHLAKLVADPAAITEGDVSVIRHVLASFVTRHGAPGSARHATVRAAQARNAALPEHGIFRSALVQRLLKLPQVDGFASLEAVAAPLGEGEAEPALIGASVPTYLHGKLLRSLDTTIDELVALRVIGSGEVLARVLPQVTAQVRAAGIADPALRRLYAALYAAFRKRRSLLLLGLQHQVRLEELPWVAAIEKHRTGGRDARAAARHTLEQVLSLTFTAFPQQLVPNKLLQELGALGTAAGIQMPLVDELAADIFMGEFTEKFLRAAQVAANLLRGSLYERYYGLDYDRVLRMDVVRKGHRGPATAPAFAELCQELAGPNTGGRSYVAGQGMVIEQQQILTTQNLAVLFDAAGLSSILRERLVEMAQACFTWICRRLQVKTAERHAKLTRIKNAAYAWRHMLFYLSLVERGELRQFVGWARGELGKQRDEAFKQRFRPAVAGLEGAVNGDAFETNGAVRGHDAQRFLGWSATAHWLMD